MPVEFSIFPSGRLVVVLPDHLDAVAHFISHTCHVAETGDLVGAVAVPVSVLFGFDVLGNCSPEGVIDTVNVFFASSKVKDESIGSFACKKPLLGDAGKMDNTASCFAS